MGKGLLILIFSLVIVFLVGTGIYMCTSTDIPKYRYTIHDSRDYYHTNDIYKDSIGCITFRCNNKPITICGTYSIVNNFDK